jgi:hypothetical protein
MQVDGWALSVAFFACRPTTLTTEGRRAHGQTHLGALMEQAINVLVLVGGAFGLVSAILLLAAAIVKMFVTP